MSNSLFALCALVATVTAINPDWEAIVSAVNSNPAGTWRAQVPSARDLHRATDLIGGYKPLPAGMPSPPIKEYAVLDGPLPLDYDARVHYPECSSIQAVRDQCGCGSCFAFGAVEAFEDRICIHLRKNVTLSAQDIVSCHTDENMSCQGGNPITVWENIFAGKSEGDGAIQESCYPYSLPTCPCNHHSKTSKFPACPAEGSLDTPACDLGKKFACEAKGLYKSEAATLIPAPNMEQELFENGPITVAFHVHEDFLTYKTGVYQMTPGSKALGGHSVKIVGFGVDAGVKYWTVANSWNSEWGDNGFFKILRGVDECFIESSASVAGIPINPSTQSQRVNVTTH